MANQSGVKRPGDGLWSRALFKSGANPGSNGNGTSTTTSQVQLPAWVDQAAQSNYQQAVSDSQNLMGPYTGQRVAPITAGGNADVASLQNNIGSTNAAYADAQGTTSNFLGYQAPQVNPGQLSSTDLSSYMNPYTNQVIGSGMQAIDLQRQQALNQISDQAIQTGAFGGSRQGVAEGVTNAAAATQAGQLAAQLQSQNYTQAVGQAQSDIGTNLQGQLANQQAQLSGANLNLGAANQLGSLANSGQNAFLSGAMGALQGQTLEQQTQQSQLTAQQQAYQDAQQFPLQQLQIEMGALGMSPYGTTTTTTAPVAQGNGTMQTLGTIGSGLGILGSLAGTVAPFLAPAAVASDRREKTDIQPIGEDPETGLKLYAYRYKGDPKSYPKVVGPMAQDVRKLYPDKVEDVGGRLVIDGSLLHPARMGLLAAA
jgi:hypothetical protein